MDLLVEQKADLVNRIRATIQSGRDVLVVGWMARNNVDFTREYEDRVSFCETVPKEVGPRTGLIILTKFLYHANSKRLKRKRSERKKVYSVVLPLRIIKSAIEEACRDLVLATRSVSRAGATSVESVKETDQQVEHKDDDTVLELAIGFLEPKPVSPEEEMREFAIAFVGAVKISPKRGYVSSHVLAALRREYGVTATPQRLIREGWIEPIEGDDIARVHWYRAALALWKVVDSEVEPVHPEERVRYRIAQRPKLVAELDRLQAEMERVRKEIKTIDFLASRLSELDALLQMK